MNNAFNIMSIVEWIFDFSVITCTSTIVSIITSLIASYSEKIDNLSILNLDLISTKFIISTKLSKFVTYVQLYIAKCSFKRANEQKIKRPYC